MKKYYHYCIAFIVIFGLTITSIIYVGIKDAQDSAFEEEFIAKVNDLSSEIEREINSDLEVLRFFKGFYDSSQSVSSEEFKRFTSTALQRHRSVRAMEWIPKVSRNERSHVEQARQLEFPDFQITERLNQGEMIRAGDRPEYFPVYFVEPYLGNELALGFDLGSSEPRRTALMRASVSGQLALTAGIELVQDKPGNKGFLALMPVYQDKINQPVGRYDLLSGFVLGVFRVDAIVEKVLDKQRNRDNKGIYFEILDTTDASDGELLFSAENVTEKGRLVTELAHRKNLISVGGRIWDINAMPNKAYVTAHKDSTAEWVLMTGIAFTLIVFAYLVIIVKQTKQTQLLVEQRTSQLHIANQKLELLSLTDALTGVVNRRGFDQTLETECKRAIRENSAITLLIIDVDHFKSYNDHYGHLAGDDCLKKVAAAIAKIPCRLGDVVARYGGEEFAMILPSTEDIGAAVGERCRAAVEQLKIPHEYSPVASYVTVSVGATTLHPDQTTDPLELVKKADEAMYLAKSSGRNKVVQG